MPKCGAACAMAATAGRWSKSSSAWRSCSSRRAVRAGSSSSAVACEMLVPERQRALALYGAPWRSTAARRGARPRPHGLPRARPARRAHPPHRDRAAARARRGAARAADGADRRRAARPRRSPARRRFLVARGGQFPASLAIQDALGTVGYDDDWRAEVDRLIAIGEDADAERGARVSLRAARILRMEAPEDERYERCLQRVLDYDAYNESAHQLLDRLYAAAGRWDDARGAAGSAWWSPSPARRAGGAVPALLVQLDRARPARSRRRGCWRAIELGGLVYPIAGLTHAARHLRARGATGIGCSQPIDALLATPLDEDADVHAALLGGTIAWKAKRDLARAAATSSACAASRSTALLLIDFDDALAEQRNPGGHRRRAARAHRGGAPARRGRVDRSRDRRLAPGDRRRSVQARARAGRWRACSSKSERWRALVDALSDEESSACRDDGERVALLLQMVTIYRDRLRQEILAIQGARPRARARAGKPGRARSARGAARGDRPLRRGGRRRSSASSSTSKIPPRRCSSIFAWPRSSASVSATSPRRCASSTARSRSIPRSRMWPRGSRRPISGAANGTS